MDKEKKALWVFFVPGTFISIIATILKAALQS